MRRSCCGPHGHALLAVIAAGLDPLRHLRRHPGVRGPHPRLPLNDDRARTVPPAETFLPHVAPRFRPLLAGEKPELRPFAWSRMRCAAGRRPPTVLVEATVALGYVACSGRGAMRLPPLSFIPLLLVAACDVGESSELDELETSTEWAQDPGLDLYAWVDHNTFADTARSDDKETPRAELHTRYYDNAGHYVEGATPYRLGLAL